MTDTVIERREVPPWVERIITSKGGLTPFGKPLYRVIWGANRYHKVGGMFKKVLTVTDCDGEQHTIVTQVPELRDMLRYHPFRWHLEKWVPPDFYGTRDEFYRNTWDEEAQLHTMGDYPSDGEYEHVFYLGMCPHVTESSPEWCKPCWASSGQYLPLEDNVDLLVRHIHLLQKSINIPMMLQKSALFERETTKRRIRRDSVTAAVEEAMRPQLALQPTSWQSGTNSRCSVPEPKFRLDQHMARATKGLVQGHPLDNK